MQSFILHRSPRRCHRQPPCLLVLLPLLPLLLLPLLLLVLLPLPLLVLLLVLIQPRVSRAEGPWQALA